MTAEQHNDKGIRYAAAYGIKTNDMYIGARDIHGLQCLYKDPLAYEKLPDGVCYISDEQFSQDGYIMGKIPCLPIRSGVGYTRNALMRMCRNDKTRCDYLFYEMLRGSQPEWNEELYEWQINRQMRKQYGFVQTGARVLWTNPEDGTQKKKTVININLEEDWNEQTIARLGGGVKAHLSELTEIKKTPD